MNKWKTLLNFDPIPPLVSMKSKALSYFIKKDLLEEDIGSIEQLWEINEAQQILKKQQENGSWEYPGGKKNLRSQENYDQLETYRQIGFLVELYGFNKTHPSIKNAAEYILSFQNYSFI